MHPRDLTRRLVDLLRREHNALGDFLVALADFDRRGAWRDLGHASLFAFVRRELGLSAGAAYQRTVAAVLLQRFPDVIVPLRDGRLCMSSIVELSKVISPENHHDILPRFFGCSKREAMVIAKEIRPLESPPLREVITAVRAAPAHSTRDEARVVSDVPPPERRGPPGSSDAPLPQRPGPPGSESTCQAAQGHPPGLPLELPSLEQPSLPPVSLEPSSYSAPLDGLSRPSGPAALTSPSLESPALKARSLGPTRIPPGSQAASIEKCSDAGAQANVPPPSLRATALQPAHESIQPLTADLSRLHLTVSRRFVDKLDAARDALSHARPRGSNAEILEAALDLLLQHHGKSKGLTSRPRKRTSPPKAKHIPASVRREVWERDKGRCQWPVDSGGVCGSTTRVQFDHIVPRAKGGPSTTANTRLLCAPHNQLAARREFGDRWMDRFAPRRPPRVGEVVAEYGAAPRGNVIYLRASPRVVMTEPRASPEPDG